MCSTRSRSGGSRDVRLQGFPDRTSLEEAQRWLDDLPVNRDEEEIGVDACVGRLAAAPVDAPSDLPPVARAAEDGYAIRAEDSLGASAYGPQLLVLAPPAATLAQGSAVLVAAGEALPEGADAVVPFEAAQASGTEVEVTSAVAVGTGVDQPGRLVRAGTRLFGPARPLRPQDAALLAALGMQQVRVARRPRVRLVVAGPKRCGASPSPADASGLLLRALLGRDGCAVDAVPTRADLRDAVLEAAAEPAPDLLLVVGRTGTGADDEAPLAVARAGELAVHGIALRPGGTAGLGRIGAAPVALLPGDPLACMFAYELVAGRLVRRLAGGDPGLPHAVLEAEASRKIVSTVGFVEACQVRLVDGRAEPVGSAEAGGLASAARADGFVLVPAGSEGYAPGSRVTVRLYG